MQQQLDDSADDCVCGSHLLWHTFHERVRFIFRLRFGCCLPVTVCERELATDSFCANVLERCIYVGLALRAGDGDRGLSDHFYGADAVGRIALIDDYCRE